MATHLIDDQPTEVRGVDAETEAVIAWSRSDDLPPLPYDNRRPLSLALRMLLTTVCVAAVSLATFVIGEHVTGSMDHHAARPAAAGPAPRPVAAPPAKAPAPAVPAPAPAPNPVPPAPVSMPPQPVPPQSAPQQPPPSAESQDDLFLQKLDNRGIGYTNRAGQISQGWQICAALDGGESYAQLLSEMYGTDWSAGIIHAAVAVYCPQHQELLP